MLHSNILTRRNFLPVLMEWKIQYVKTLVPYHTVLYCTHVTFSYIHLPFTINKLHNNTKNVFQYCSFLRMARGCSQNMQQYFVDILIKIYQLSYSLGPCPFQHWNRVSPESLQDALHCESSCQAVLPPMLHRHPQIYHGPSFLSPTQI